MPDGEAPLTKDGGGAHALPPRRSRLIVLAVDLLWLIPFAILYAVIIGVGARMAMIAFEWGWDLFGWA